MNIIEAIATAADTRAVYGLLSAYFDAVRGHDIALALPARLTLAPIGGMHDLTRRHAEARELHTRSAAALCRLDPLLCEFTEVCRVAMQRLQCLEQPLEHAA